jgi:outer membrane biosynthesis protein TonB
MILSLVTALLRGIGIVLICGQDDLPTTPAPEPVEANTPVPEAPRRQPVAPTRSSAPSPTPAPTPVSVPDAREIPAPTPPPPARTNAPLEIRGLLSDAQGGIGGVRLVLVETANPTALIAETTSAAPSDGVDEGTFTFSIKTAAREMAVAVMHEGWAVTHSGPFTLSGDTEEPVEVSVTGANPSNLLGQVRFLAASIEQLGQTSPLGGATVSLVGDPLTSGLL